MPPKRKSAAAAGKTRSTKPKASPAKKTAAVAKPAPKPVAAKKTAAKRATPATSPLTPDFSSLTVAQLKAECTKRGLETSGTKTVLIKRLNDSVQNDGDDSGPPAKLQKQSTIQRALESMKKMAAADSRIVKPGSMKVDQYCHLPNAQVVDDYSCMLNQTNIGFNNNKYYVIQVIKSNNNYYAFNRWGRVGEPGQQATKGPFVDSKKAVADFEHKFFDKTKNAWEDRANFEAVPGKYTLLDIGDDEDGDAGQQRNQVVQRVDGTTGVLAAYKPCTLEVSTQCLVKLVFDNDMFKEALIKLEIDVKKMPLGKLSKTQIVKGFEVLDDIKTALDAKSQTGKKLEELSSKFYTVIPHDFGRQRPPVINTHDLLRTKLDMLITLGDIEQAQEMLHNKGDVAPKAGELDDHPLDQQYKLLQCSLGLVKVGEHEFKADRVKAHDKITHRKLLWHGTNVAVVAAILKSGLRIMPHSGGRVGKGIYFASENSKSAGYVQTNKNIGIMFLNEAILGKEHHISRDNHTLTKPPPGFDSIVAKGQTEPDPKFDTTLMLDGKTVIVPQGVPIRQPQFQGSSFSQSEYLVYQENQVRMRYMLQLQMDY